MDIFIKSMPKIELHAHLNGSFTYEILMELGKLKYGKDTSDCLKFQEKCQNLQNYFSKSLSECFQIFKIAHELITTLELLEHATLLVIREFFLDNTIYLELRTTPKSANGFSKKEYLKTVLQAITTSEKLYPKIKVKLLPSFDRSRGIEDAEDTLNVVCELLNEYSNIIKGIDISGDPTAGNFQEYKNILNRARENGLKLTLHCGEIHNTDSEIKEMIEFGMERLGHGTFIQDENLKLLKEKNIAVECCLSSNVKCGTVKDFNDHHFNEMFFKQNIPVVICTDDCGVFDTTLSNEISIVVDTFNLTKNDIWKLMNYAILYSFADKSEKNTIKIIIDNYFENNSCE